MGPEKVFIIKSLYFSKWTLEFELEWCGADSNQTLALVAQWLCIHVVLFHPPLVLHFGCSPSVHRPVVTQPPFPTRHHSIIWSVYRVVLDPAHLMSSLSVRCSRKCPEMSMGYGAMLHSHGFPLSLSVFILHSPLFSITLECYTV